ncbi:uncharacterized protein BDZ99DRAFT_517173 [Mytilinidion resinicola]|uniref:Uncharacterized protein n=1 Tax=Mytilinidion resinicola TaxID=574789 RepID=A0A6A6YXY9_9PEZI|nr:uncharacterized protein BDZ99DRAFT_517173 [Mytilinidion resinicola]KAF2812864.1 hypothetical protein BDZ99DRAFT_517173 [Mytilinidion resinicola]
MINEATLTSNTYLDENELRECISEGVGMILARWNHRKQPLISVELEAFPQNELGRCINPWRYRSHKPHDLNWRPIKRRLPKPLPYSSRCAMMSSKAIDYITEGMGNLSLGMSPKWETQTKRTYPAMFSLFHITKIIAKARESESTELSDALIEIFASTAVKTFTSRCKHKYPKACRYVYPGCQTTDLFDEHDMRTNEGKFLDEVVRFLAAENMERVKSFCYKFDRERLPDIVRIYYDNPSDPLEIVDTCGLFQQEEIDFYGREFLWHALNEMKSALIWVAESQQEQKADGSSNELLAAATDDQDEEPLPKEEELISSDAEDIQSGSSACAMTLTEGSTIGNENSLPKGKESKPTKNSEQARKPTTLDEEATQPDSQSKVIVEGPLRMNNDQSPNGERAELTRKPKSSKAESSQTVLPDRAPKKDPEFKSKEKKRKGTKPEQEEKRPKQKETKPEHKKTSVEQRERQAKQRKVEQKVRNPEHKARQPEKKQDNPGQRKMKLEQTEKKPRGAKKPTQQAGPCRRKNQSIKTSLSIEMLPRSLLNPGIRKGQNARKDDPGSRAL